MVDQSIGESFNTTTIGIDRNIFFSPNNANDSGNIIKLLHSK